MQAFSVIPTGPKRTVFEEITEKFNAVTELFKKAKAEPRDCASNLLERAIFDATLPHPTTIVIKHSVSQIACEVLGIASKSPSPLSLAGPAWMLFTSTCQLIRAYRT